MGNGTHGQADVFLVRPCVGEQRCCSLGSCFSHRLTGTTGGCRGDVYSLVCQQEAMGEKVVVMAPVLVAACLLLISQHAYTEKNCSDYSH